MNSVLKRGKNVSITRFIDQTKNKLIGHLITYEDGTDEFIAIGSDESGDNSHKIPVDIKQVGKKWK